MLWSKEAKKHLEVDSTAKSILAAATIASNRMSSSGGRPIKVTV